MTFRIGEAAFAAAIGIVLFGFVVADRAATDRAAKPTTAQDATDQVDQALMTISAAGFGEINICTASPERLAKFYETVKIRSSNNTPAIPQAIMDAALEKYETGNVAACAEIATRHALAAPDNAAIAEWIETLIFYDLSCDHIPGLKSSAIKALDPIPYEINMAAVDHVFAFSKNVGLLRFCELTKAKINNMQIIDGH